VVESFRFFVCLKGHSMENLINLKSCDKETEDKIDRTGQHGGQLGQDKGIGQP
jgi:hypothetical protein